MIKTKRLFSFAMALVLSLSALVAFEPGRAFAATRTWDGGGDDDNWSTAENWAGDVAPESGDSLVFPVNLDWENLVNDIEGATWAGITFSGNPGSIPNCVNSNTRRITGNAFFLSGNVELAGNGASCNVTVTIEAPMSLVGASVSFIANHSLDDGSGHRSLNIGDYEQVSPKFGLSAQSLTLSGNSPINLNTGVTGSGNILSNSTSYVSIGPSADYTGSITINSGVLNIDNVTALGTTAGGTSIKDGATLQLSSCDLGQWVVNENIILEGAGFKHSEADGGHQLSKLITGGKCTGGAPNVYGLGFAAGVNWELAGNLTLESDVDLWATAEDTKISGNISGNYVIKLITGSPGKLTVASDDNQSKTKNGEYQAEPLKHTLSEKEPETEIYVNKANDVVVTGERGDVYVGGGRLLGTGTVRHITMSAGAVAPGLSPGCLTSGNLTYTGGSLEVEIDGKEACSQYDRQVVNGTVDLGSNTELIVQRANDYKPVIGAKFVIVANDGDDAITGTFKGYAEGALINVDGVSYRISYVGGDGNDIELTVIGGPNTGIQRFVMANPLVILIASVLAAGAVFYLVQNSRLAFARKRS